MTDSFEIKKNSQAFSYTALICGMIFLFVFFYNFPIAIPVVKYPPDLIEINLGNDKEGRGDVQPLIKGTPGEQADHSTPAKVAATSTKDIESDNSDNPDAAAVNKSPIKNKDPKEVTPVNKTHTTTNYTTPDKQPVKKPKSLYGGGTGTGGNNATEDNGFRNQGNKDGNGDIGSPNGTPTGRVFGVRNASFGTLKDEFNENAKVAVIVTVNAEGSVTNATVIDKGTTTTNSKIRALAHQQAMQLKFPKGKAEETGTIIFNYKVHD